MNGYPTLRTIAPEPKRAEVVARLMGGESVVDIERDIGRRVMAAELERAAWILSALGAVHRPRVSVP